MGSKPINPDVLAAATAAPQGYVCHRAAGPINLTGRGDDPAWDRVPWTADFVDIQGSPKPPPPLRTRLKMCHDGERFYLFAKMDEPHVNAGITTKNSVIFKDNDFEVFLDPDWDNFNYHEIELNALNTIWELTLPAPYRTGATPTDPDNLPGLRTAVHVDGTLNDPSDTDVGWTAELSIPFADLARFGGPPNGPPAEGQTWRVNFSRVEWTYSSKDGKYVKAPPGQAESNWVWSPQGAIDMHRPATWGYVRFTNQPPPNDPSPNESSPAHPSPVHPLLRPDPALPARNRLMAVWEAMLQAPDARFADELNLPASDLPVTLTREANGWTATAASGGRTVHVNQAGRIWEDSGARD